MPVEERRKLQRFNLRFLGTAEMNGNKEKSTEDIITRDISAGGFYLYTNTPPHAGSSVQLTINWASKAGQLATVLQASGKILRSEQIDTDTYGFALQCEEFPWKPKNIQEDVFEYYNSLGKIKRYLEENYSRKIPLEAAARIAAMEATYFSTFFHKKVGVPFRDWLRHARITKAMELIAKRDYSLTEVAFAVGYSDLRTFERAFKKVVKLNPQQFKKSVQP
jgi:AraC-like DNA-binding protein